MIIVDFIYVKDFTKNSIYKHTQILSFDELPPIEEIPLLKIEGGVLKPIYCVKNPIYKEQFIILSELYNNDLSNNRLNCELTLTKIYKGDYIKMDSI